jgi:hypothetical protein
VEIGAEAESGLCQSRELANCHPVPHGDWESRDRRSCSAVLNVPLNCTTYWIGPVEHKNR